MSAGMVASYFTEMAALGEQRGAVRGLRLTAARDDVTLWTLDDLYQSAA